MLKKISQWLGGLSGASSGAGEPLAQICLFGKHPGWDDHMEDLGLVTQLLVDVRRGLYAEGIAGNIDSGAWEKLAPDARIARFDHAFVWRQGPTEFVYGRLWASRDARGRDKYPMVACYHSRGLRLEKMAPRYAAIIARLTDACRRTDDSHAVRGEFLRESEAAKAQAPALIGESAAFDAACLKLAATDAALLADGHEGLTRCCYSIWREGEAAAKAIKAGTPRGSHTRLPVIDVAESSLGRGGSAWVWTSVAHDVLGERNIAHEGLVAIESLEFGHVDLICCGAQGRFAPTELFGLKAARSAIPAANEVPYTIEPAFASQVKARAAAWTADPSQGGAG
ncbi:MAG: hypothetical protein K2Y21_06655 [Phycisphaerales bacterium]|nr:hypothetical protein [Phycisphaerales bacterium]